MNYDTNPLRGETKPLRGQTEPLRKHNTHKHCPTLMKTTAGTHNHSVALMGNNCRGPMLIRVSPYMNYHSQPLRGQTIPLYMVIYWLCTPLFFVSSCPMFIRGFPLYGYLLTVYTPIFAYFIARCERSTSSPNFIRGFPLYGYFLTVHHWFCIIYYALWLFHLK